nr:IS6 family transposase [Emcibacter sp.]
MRQFVFGGNDPSLASQIDKKRRSFPQQYSSWKWHLDEVFVKIRGELHYLWRAVDHEGEVLDSIVTKKRNRKAALKLLKRLMKRYGRARLIVTDRLKSYKAALREIGCTDKHDTTKGQNNRAENSHLPFRRREQAMLKFRKEETLQKFTSIHAQIYNHFNGERHLTRRSIFKPFRSDSLTEWKSLMA